MNIKKLFSRKAEGQQEATEQSAPQPLAIEGISPAPLTPEPDDAELAAQAVLEVLSEECRVKSEEFATARHKRKHKADARTDLQSGRKEYKDLKSDTRKRIADVDTQGDGIANPAERSAAYYKHLAERMRKAHAAAHWRTVRFLAFAEQELRKPHLPATGPGSLDLLETEILKRQDVIDREGGELRRRWQTVLARTTVRLMAALPTGDEDTPENALT